MLLIANVAFGQTDSTKVRTYYCEAYCVNHNSKKTDVYLDFGDIGPGAYGSLNDDWKPVDNTGKYIEFNFFANLVNWMADRGWSVVTQQFKFDSAFTTCYLLLSKKTSKNKIKEGIILKGDK